MEKNEELVVVPKNLEMPQRDDLETFFEDLKRLGNPFGRRVPITGQADGQQESAMKVEDFVRTDTGETRKKVTWEKSLSRDDFTRIHDMAKRHNGFYSRFAKGMLFDSEENANAFMQEARSIMGGVKYSLYKREREDAKQNLKNALTNPDNKRDVLMGHFSPDVLDAIHALGLTNINEASLVILKENEISHILKHSELTNDDIMQLVDIFDNPDYVALTSGSRNGTKILFLNEQDNRQKLLVTIYGGKNNRGYIKTFYYPNKNMLDKWKKTGVRVGVVAKSTSRADERSSSTLHGALHGLIAPSYAPTLQRNVTQDSEDANSRTRNSPSAARLTRLCRRGRCATSTRTCWTRASTRPRPSPSGRTARWRGSTA